MSSPIPLLVFADDWGRHPSSCQYLIKELLPQHQVFWINTIGTRRPRLDWSTFKRGIGKLKQWGVKKNAKKLPANLLVCNPRMWPWFTSSLDRRINEILLCQQLSGLIKSLDRPPLVISTIPIVSDLMSKLEVSGWVYYCVDDFSTWPGLDGPVLGRMEREMVLRADTIITASHHLQSRIATFGRSSHLLTHGVDIAFWQKPSSPSPHPSPLTPYEEPYILFSGIVDRRMDTAYLRRLALDLTRGTIVLAGPEQDPDSEIYHLPHVKLIGKMPVEVLPHLAHKASVLIMPYSNLPVTQAMQPLKLKEYLATNKAVVVSDLPANREWADCLDIAYSAAHFSELVRQYLDRGPSHAQLDSRKRLAQESWKKKSELFTQFIHNGCS